MIVDHTTRMPTVDTEVIQRKARLVSITLITTPMIITAADNTIPVIGTWREDRPDNWCGASPRIDSDRSMRPVE